MWFGFGLITAILAFVSALRHRQQASWKGAIRTLENASLAYEYEGANFVRSNKEVTKVRIGVAAPPGLQFRLREEGTHDAFFKLLGICEEMQTADARFDARLYLEADAIALGYVLRQQSSLRESILWIFDVARALELEHCQLRCMGGRLWIEFESANERQLLDAPRKLVPELHTITNTLQQNRLEADNAHDPFIWRAAAVLSVSTAAAVLGGLGLFRSLGGPTVILEPLKFFLACVPIGLVFAGAFLLLILVFLGRTSRTHLVLFEASIVGTFGFVTGTFVLAREANIEFDTSSAERHELPAARVEHRITGKRGTHHYYLHAPDWQPNGTRYLEITIKSETFARLNGRSGAIVVTRRGALGYEWVEDIAPPG